MTSTIKFYTDVHIAREAVRQLRQKGIDIIHCGDANLSDADDLVHLEYATQQRRVMVSCDEGFERYHALWQTQGKQHAGIVYFRMQDQCQSISIVVREIIFLHEAADYETDLYNRIWRA
jgi:predicted nuclease of predicted toxin-antitoxin system